VCLRVLQQIIITVDIHLRYIYSAGKQFEKARHYVRAPSLLVSCVVVFVIVSRPTTEPDAAVHLCLFLLMRAYSPTALNRPGTDGRR